MQMLTGSSEFSDHTVTFLTGLPPWIFVRKAYQARERIVSAFNNFFAGKSDEKASKLVQVRAKVLRDYGIPEADVARFESVNGFGILLNLLPTAFWTLFHVLADPQLLEVVREEAKAAFGPQKSDAVLGEAMDLTAADRLPTLSSILMESLRYHTAGAAVRMVMEDHMLDGKFLLKRDNYVLIPNRGAHFDTEAWGANVDEFDAYRFDKRRGVKVHPTAFRGFGGGVNLCPGRMFASKIIVLIVASLVQRFDVQPVTKSGEWEDPGRDETSMAIVLARPKEKVMVRLVPREA
jgi:cytochrome P450